jgi:hypothetical protein
MFYWQKVYTAVKRSRMYLVTDDPYTKDTINLITSSHPAHAKLNENIVSTLQIFIFVLSFHQRLN